MQDGIAADLGIFVNEAVRADVRAFTNFRGFRDHSGRVDAWRVPRRLIKKFDGVREGKIRILRTQSCNSGQIGAPFKSDAFLDQDRRCAGGLQQWKVAAICQEGDMPWLGGFDAGNPSNLSIGIAFEPSGEFLCNFEEFHEQDS